MNQMKQFLSFTAFRAFVDGLFTLYYNLKPTEAVFNSFKSVLEFIDQAYFGQTASEFYVVFTPCYTCIMHSELFISTILNLGLDILIFKVSFTDNSININFICHGI